MRSEYAHVLGYDLLILLESVFFAVVAMTL